jgi:hypothetical protein
MLVMKIELYFQIFYEGLMTERFDALILTSGIIGSIFPCAATVFIHEETVYLIRTGKLGAVIEFGGILQGSVTSERQGNEFKIHERRPEELISMSNKRPSVRFLRSEIQAISRHRVNPNPLTWLNLLLHPTLRIKTSKGTFCLSFYNQPSSKIDELIKSLEKNAEAAAS